MKTIFTIGLIAVVAGCTSEEVASTQPSEPVSKPDAVAAYRPAPKMDRVVWVNPIDGETYMRLADGRMLTNMNTGKNYLRVGTSFATNLETGELEYMGGW